MSQATIDDNVRTFAKYLNCDPELAQELYFKLEVTLSLDDENKEDTKRELDALSRVASKLASARQLLEKLPDNSSTLRFVLEAEDLDLLTSITDLHEKTEEIVGFGRMQLSEETSGSRANLRADKIAGYVASVFIALDKPITTGTSAYQHDEPSTDYGRAVREALKIFNVHKVREATNLPFQTPHWKRPAIKAAQKSQKANPQK